MTGARGLVLALLGLSAIAALVVAGTVFGTVRLPLAQVVRILAHAVPGSGIGASPGPVTAPVTTPVAGPLAARIVLDLRLPRALLAGLTGAGLAVVGVLLQAATRNSLADPFVFGLSSGAAAGAVLVISFTGDRFGAWTLPAAVFCGSILSALCVVGLVATQRQRGPDRVVIAGLAVSFLFGALTNVMVFAGDQRAARSVLFWSLGGFGLARWSNLPLALFGLAVALGAGLAWRRALDALLAGEETALSLGIPVGRLRLGLFVASAVATASFVALAGVIGFVGLMVPHLARAVVGIRHAPLLAASAILGAMLMLAADLASRLILAPQELPVGIVAAGLGAAFVLAMLLAPSRSPRRH